MYDEINDVALKEYSGLDDVVLGRMNPPQLDPLSETALEYRVVTIAFLPPEVDRAGGDADEDPPDRLGHLGRHVGQPVRGV